MNMKAVTQTLALIAVVGLAQASLARTAKVVEKPGTKLVTPRTSVPQIKPAQVNAGAVAFGEQGESCSRSEVEAGLTAGGAVTSEDAAVATSSGQLVVQSCKAGARGILNMGAKARKVAVETVNLAVRAGQKVSARFLAMAKANVLGIQTTAAAEEANFAKLTNGECQVFAQ